MITLRLKLFISVCVSITINFIFADIIPYKNHNIYPEKPEYLLIPKFSKHDAPSWSPGHGHSYIDLSQLVLSVDCSNDKTGQCIKSTVNFELLMFEIPDDQQWYDYWPDNAFCCNPEQLKEEQ